jgi:hypothetical protein
MTITEILALIKSLSDTTKTVVDSLTAHAAKLDAVYAAVAEHQKQIDAQGPALPAGPILKG